MSNAENQVERWCRQIAKRDGEFDREVAMVYALEAVTSDRFGSGREAAYLAVEHGARKAREAAERARSA